MPEGPPSAEVPEYFPGALNVLVHLSVFKCKSCGWTSNQMWVEQNSQHKTCFMYMQKEKIIALGKLLKLVLDICFL